MLKWIMLAIYVVLNIYVLWHLLYLLNMTAKEYRKEAAAMAILWVLPASTIFLGKLLNLSWIIKSGNYWLGFFIYLVFFFIVGDIFLLIWRKIKGNKRSKKGRYIFLGFVLGCSIIFSIYGSIHARHMTTVDYDVTIHKDGGNVKDLNVVLIADLHLGYSFGSSDMEKMVASINNEEPDLVILAGDIIDNAYDTLDDPEQLAAIFRSIKSRLGVYAVYGNHDVEEMLLGGFSVASSKEVLRDDRLDQLMEKSGIIILEDETILLEDSFYLTGRLDEEKNGYGSDERQSIQELTDSLDKNKPLIVINHEPDHLSDYAECGVDVLLSGHTHAGQFFPLTIVQPLAWENHWGIKKIEEMYSIVTSGVGVYGPPVRVFTNSEVMRINIHFE